MNKIEKYEAIIKAQSGVLYLKGKPGMAKTAILKDIAKKNGWKYFDRRLSQKDSTEISGLPYKGDNKGVPVMEYAYPKYLVEANEQPSLIVFEELNRATLDTRNAALQILLERRVEDFELNENVFMAVTGNLGEEDGTEVEEFDTALNGRLIHMEHDLTIQEWVDGYAKENVNSWLIKFVENNPSYFHRLTNDTDNKYPAYPSPRSWTFLSDLVGKDAKSEHILNLVKEVGVCYIGGASMKLIRYLEDTMVLNIKDVMDRYDQVKTQLKKINRDKVSELLNELKGIEIRKLEEVQYANLTKFLKGIDADERVGYLHTILFNYTKDDTKKHPAFLKFVRGFKDDYMAIQKDAVK